MTNMNHKIPSSNGISIKSVGEKQAQFSDLISKLYWKC